MFRGKCELHALRSIPTSENSMNARSITDEQLTLTDGDDVSVELKGKYTLVKPIYNIVRAKKYTASYSAQLVIPLEIRKNLN